MKIKVSVAIILILIVSALFYFSPHLAVHNMRKAAEARDSVKLSTYVDFPALKENLKGSLNALMGKEMLNKSTDSGFAALGMAFVNVMINSMVDALVTPESLTLMIEGNKPLAEKPQEDNIDIDTSMSYESFDSFLVKVKPKKNSKETPVGFVFTREGLVSWKLTALRLPAMQKAATSSEPAATFAKREDQAEVKIEKLWKYEDENDKFEGRKQYVISDIESSTSSRAQLAFRKSKDGMEAIIITGDGYICARDDELDAAVVFDNEAPTSWHFSLAKSNKAIFFRSPEDFAKKLEASKEVYIRIDDTCGTRTDLTIKSKGFAEAYAQFK